MPSCDCSARAVSSLPRRAGTRLSGVLLAVLALLLLGACGVAPVPLATVGPSTSIRLGLSAVTSDSVAIMVARDFGFLAKNGLKVDDVVSYRGGPLTTQALVAGDVQFAVVSGPAIVDAHAVGADLEMIVGLDNVLGYEFVVLPSITDGQQLKGKTLGISGTSGSSDWAVGYALREIFKLDPAVDVKMAVIGNEVDRLTAMRMRQIDGTVMTRETAAAAEEAGMTVLAKLWDKGIPYPLAGVAVSRSFASQNPRIVSALVRSVVESIAFIRDPKNKSAVIGTLSNVLNADDKTVLELGYSILVDTLLQPAPYVDESGMATVLAGAPAASQSAAQVSDFVDNSYVKQLDDSGFITGLYKK